jgi:hypothetical protein
MEEHMSKTQVVLAAASASIILLTGLWALGQDRGSDPACPAAPSMNESPAAPQSPPTRAEVGPSRLESYSIRCGTGDTGRSVEITQDRSGRIHMSIVDVKDGRQTPRLYEADSPRAFREKYPEVAREYGIDETDRLPRFVRDLLSEEPGCCLPGASLGMQHGNARERLDRIQEWFRREVDDVFGFRHRTRAESKPERERAEGESLSPGSPAHPTPSPHRLLGIRVSAVSPVLRDQLRLDSEGVVVDEVLPGSLAERAGLHLHDIILSVDGRTVRDPGDLRHAVVEEESKDGVKSLDIRVMRGGIRQEVTVDLASK